MDLIYCPEERIHLLVANGQERTKKCNTNLYVTMKKTKQTFTQTCCPLELEEALKCWKGDGR